MLELLRSPELNPFGDLVEEELLGQYYVGLLERGRVELFNTIPSDALPMSVWRKYCLENGNPEFLDYCMENLVLPRPSSSSSPSASPPLIPLSR